MTKEELKQEAEEYVKQNYCEMCIMADDCKCGCIDCFTVSAYLASAEPREKKITELEKENAELKERLKEHESVGNSQFWKNVWSWKTKAMQLTKAKELLERLLITSCNSDVLNLLPNCSEVLRVRVEAEQFLKDSKGE